MPEPALACLKAAFTSEFPAEALWQTQVGGVDEGCRFWGLLAGSELSCVWSSLVSQALLSFGCFPKAEALEVS